MIWRLTYCNKKGVEARVDIIKGDTTSVEIVEGSSNPFTISYKLDKNDKSGHIMTSSADIEIYETETFNIDDLKTSNETELKVEYFEDNVLTWTGFILPDFFSREIGSPNIVRMTASDRLTALKGVTLSDLPARVSLRNLIERCLNKTGLTLNLESQIQINQGSTNILDSEILSQRLTDTRGRSISCYDILMSIMVATNSTIRQRKGQWVVYNKLEHELRTPTIFFDKVERGAIRTIQPVASSVGVYQEFGGGRFHPDNYDFSQGLVNWSSINGFVAEVENRSIDGYTLVQVPTIFMQPIYGEVTTKNTIRNINTTPGFDPNYDNVPYLKSDDIPIVSVSEDSVDINFNISAIGPHNAALRYVVLATKGSTRLYLNGAGTFETFNPTNEEHVSLLSFGQPGINVASVKSKSIKGTLNNPTGYSISIRIYGSGTGNPVFINFASISFANAQDVPKGSIYKTEQGSNFTKIHEVETTIWGDYITNGLNGYFYNYPIDDTSNLYLPSGELSSPEWITPFDTTGRPLLHHISRQKSRLFSVAHDILRANINVESFDPLAVFQDCKGGKYVVVSASFDFLRSEADVELEQIAYDNTILKRDFIYSYFGEGEDSIKSIGGIAGGGGGTGGGGMTSEQLAILNNLASWWKLDEENDAIYSEKSIYSLKGVSAFGLGEGGGSGGGGIDRLDSWANYTEAKADYYVPASLLVPFRDDTLSRIEALEADDGSSTPQYWTLDEDGNLKTEYNVYSTKGVSALGLGEGGSSGGGGTDMLQSWGDYTSDKADYYVPASLLVPFRSDTLGRLTSLENGSATSIETTGSGNAITSVSKSGNTLTFAKGSTFSLSTHNHVIANITGLQDALDEKEPAFTKNSAFNKNFGTTAGTVTQGNDSRIINGQTAYGWGNHASAGYALNSALTAHTGNSTIHITSTERTNWNLAYTQRHTHGNKSVLDALTQGHINVLNKLSLDAQGNVKVDATLWATGGITALST